MINSIRKFIRKSSFFRKLVAYTLVPSGFFDNYFRNYQPDEGWIKRNAIVLESDDNNKIPRSEKAGTIKNGKQFLHNDIRISLGSYYGPEVTRLLIDNKGVHEPQEEYVFMEVLKALPEKATMIEMGAFWGFYSMWFNKEIKQATNYLIEPDEFNIISGKKNFRLNKMNGHFSQYFISNKSNNIKGETPTICVDDFVQQNNISFIDILHSDIQGFEFEMLKGATQTFATNKVGYIFISTHSNQVHEECLQFLREKNFKIVANANLDESFSLDGLIVGKSPSYNYGPDVVQISIRK
ncbi:MAG: FkbM family methyltransferase [Bacteroidetes bacterium]|nr:FkbM family methyltransferase [Bacteroidota bacterium]MBS1649262.1 FkbM family methyltransferase [Bacteroidota bacterium]